ncbi:hypothetical protein [Thalassobium sp. R2A62]|uniref:hypothetical protein n=1 Tax=Thalassobium sp. R2A62 TaxID=633131 RepID=UPI0001B1CD6A|nr:hypothetical protein [Thalassobium sp. R2A62]EET48370.1 hypothetical protein TR2A62_0538 [Thalassobium sp. R2A62]
MLVFSIVIFVTALIAPVVMNLVRSQGSWGLWSFVTVMNFLFIAGLGLQQISYIAALVLPFAYFIWIGLAEGIAKKKFPLWHKKSYRWRFEDEDNPVVAARKAKEAEAEAEKKAKEAEAEEARLAVIFEQDRKKQKAKAEAQTLKMYGSGPVAIDGANLWGRVYSDTDEDHQKAFEAVANLLVRLKASGYDPHVFWDSKFHRFAKHLQLAGLSEGLPNMLSELLSIEKQMITVSQRGLAADADIIAWATLKEAAIISNDNFNKEIEDEIILSRAISLKERGLLKKFSHSAGDIVVPGLTNLV